MDKIHNLSLLILALAFAPPAAWSQGRPFLGAGAQVSENFDWTSGGTVQNLAWVQNADQAWALPGTTQKGWYASFNADPAMFAITNGTTNTGGGMLSNFFYVSADSDRSLGGRPTNAGGPLILALRLTNVSDQTLTRFSISYATEVTQQRDAAVSNTFVFGYSLGATEVDLRTGAGYTLPGDTLNATTPLTSVASNVNGNSVRTVVEAQTIEGIEWAPGTDLWLRWIAPNVTGGPNLALDDVVFTAFGEGVAPPAPATGLVVQPVAATTLQLTWIDNSSDETGFRVERRAGQGPYETAATLAPGVTLYRDQGLAHDILYTYRVVAFRDEMDALPSNEAAWDLVLGPPAAPAAFAARVVSWNTVHLTWDRADYNGIGFEIERSQDGEWTQLAVITNLSTSSHVDTGLPEATRYTYRIRSYNDQGASEWQLAGPVVTEAWPEVFTTGADPIDQADIHVTLHADPVNGDDLTGDGSAAQPFRTIEKAVAAAKPHNADGLGVRIVLHPGVYLEGEPNRDVDFGAVILSGYWTTSAPLIIEGAGWEPGRNTGDVIITGAEEWSDWSAKDGNGVQVKEWPYDWGLNPRAQSVAPDVIKRLELLWVREPDGEWRNYVQVLGPGQTSILDNLSPEDGYFWIDEAADTISVRPPDGVDLNGEGVVARVTTRKRLIHHWRPQVSTSLTPFAIRNVVFEHSGDIALYLQNVRQITIEDCLFRRNKIDGFSNGSFGDARWTLRNCVFHDNGVSGFTGGGDHLLAENLDIHGNGRLAYLSNYTGWANEGMKVALMRNSSLRNWRVWDNWGVGIWLDTGIYRTEVAEMLVWNNRSSGIFIENNNPNNIPGLGLTPTVILRDSVFFNNNAQGTTLLGRGIAVGESENVIIDNVVVVDNDTQIAVANNVRGQNFNTVISNSLAGAALPRLNGLFLPRNGLGDWQDLFDTLDARTNDNVYVMDLAAAFTGRNGEAISFSDWQQAQFNNPFNTSADKAVDWRSLFVQAPYDGRPLVNVFALADAVLEGEADAPVFLVTRLGPDISSPLVVDLQVATGTGYFDPAGAGQLDAPFPVSVTIPAGQLSLRLPLSPALDGLIEGRQLLDVSIVPAGTAYTTSASASIVVLDADVPAGANEVYLEPAASLREGGEPVAITAVRLGATDEPLTIGLQYGGTAVAGADYTAPPATLTFAAGADSASFTIAAIDDDLPEVVRSIVVSVAADGGGSYIPVPPASQAMALEDNDTAVLSAPGRPAASGESVIIVPLTLTNPSSTGATFSLRWPAGDWLVVDSRAPDGVAYQWVDNVRPANRVSFNWNSVNDDGYTIPLPLGFTVDYYGASFESVSVNSNGFFTFGPLQNFTRRYSLVLELPNSSLNAAANMVAPFWDDFSHATGGAYLSKDDRRAVVTWDGVTRPGGRNMSFQALVNRSGVLKFQYRDVNVFPTPSAGIQNADRTQGISLAFGDAYAEAGLAVALVPNHAWIGLPEFPLTLAPGESRTLNIRISAEGLEPARYVQQLELLSDSAALSTQRLALGIDVSGDWIIPGAGWMYLDWLGWIHSYELGWFYHLSHGFLFGIPGGAESVHLWDARLGWLWTSRSFYPYLYRYDSGNWLYYSIGSSNLRLFLDYATGEWRAYP
jgi:hypothetical protein